VKRLFTPFTASLIRLQILKRLKIRADVYFFFLLLPENAAIIDHNAACGAVIVPAVRKSTPKLCSGRALFVILEGELIMAVSYKKLWKLLIDKDIKKKDLIERAKISPATVTKMGKNGHVTTEVLVKICSALDCTIADIMEVTPD